MRRNQIEAIAHQVVGAVLTVHRQLGPGLLESTYNYCLAAELRARGLRVDQQVGLPVVYNGDQLDIGYRIDLLVEGVIIIESKVVEALAPIHEAQLLTYLKLSGVKLGFLVNWNEVLVKDGIKRMVMGL